MLTSQRLISSSSPSLRNGKENGWLRRKKERPETRQNRGENRQTGMGSWPPSGGERRPAGNGPVVTGRGPVVGLLRSDGGSLRVHTVGGVEGGNWASGGAGPTGSTFQEAFQQQEGYRAEGKKAQGQEIGLGTGSGGVGRETE